MIVLIGGEKGGAGKSTIACNLAVFLASQDKDVLLLDADPQKTSSTWAYRRSVISSQQLPKLNSAEKTGDIYETVVDFSKRYSFVIIDSGGRDSTELRSAMIACDVFYTPIKPSQIDIDTLGKMNELVEHASALNKKLRSFALITHAPTNPNMDDKKETEEILSKMPNFINSNVFITYRSSYWRTMGKGLSVLEYTDDKAKNEILSLGSEVFTYE
ncbi:division plane positioning ATPase MipZ [Rickettsiaceae bacterium]|nr:division plane positioning ATPase MipZ [Rickettsiaceae bacterium]